MGEPMAGHLVDAGHQVTVWNRSPGKGESLVGRGATRAPSLGELAAGSDVIFLCVSRSEDVEECVASLAGHARKGTLFVDHSTIDPETAMSLHTDLSGRGLRFLDAPITGGSMGAQKGQLTIFIGGRKEDFDEALPVLRAYAKRAELVGGPGAGQMTKMANQIAVGGALLALCEALVFAKKAGLDLALTRELLASGAAASWAFDNYGPKILASDWSPGFSVKNQRKDFRYALQSGKAIGASLPGTELVDRLLATLEEEGHGDWTTAALYDVMLRLGEDK